MKEKLRKCLAFVLICMMWLSVLPETASAAELGISAIPAAEDSETEKDTIIETELISESIAETEGLPDSELFVDTEAQQADIQTDIRTDIQADIQTETEEAIVILPEESEEVKKLNAGNVTLTTTQIVAYMEGRVGNSYPNGKCLAFVADCFNALGATRSSTCCAYNYGSSHITSTDINNIPVGADVFFGQCGGGPCSTCKASYYGHIGVYVGNGYFVHATGGTVQKSTVSSWASKFRGWGYHGGITVVSDSTPTPAPSASYIMHIDSPNGAYTDDNHIEISGWIASKEDISYVMYEVEGVTQGSLSVEYAEDVKNCYPDYAYPRRFRGVIDKTLLSSYTTYTFKVWAGLKDSGQTSVTSSTFSTGNITIPVSNDYIVHIDSPNGAYTNDNHIEIVGWIASKQEISYVMYEIEGVRQGSLSLEYAEDVKNSYPDYAYTQRFRGVIDKNWLSSNTRYTFKVWAGIGGSPSSITTSNFSTGTITPSTCTLTYNANGGNGAPASQTAVKGNSLTVSREIPTRFGYHFLGWNTSPVATGTTYLPGATVQMTDNVTLYTVWGTAKMVTGIAAVNEYSIPISIGGASKYYMICVDTTAMYRFESTGDYDTRVYLYDENGNQLAANDDYNGNQNFRLDYQLNADTVYYIETKMYNSSVTGTYTLRMSRGYAVSFSGGTNLPATVYKYYGTALVLPTTVPTKSYTLTYNANGGSVSSSSKTVNAAFVNWNTSSTGSGSSYSPGGTYTDNASVRLYAQWNNPTAGSLETPTREGYSFTGWYTASTGGTNVTSSTTISSSQTLYAHWSANSRTITYNAMGGENGPSSQTVTNGSTQVPSAIPDKFGYTFMGWSTSSGATRKAEYLPGDTISCTADITLYAVWEACVRIDDNPEYQACSVTISIPGTVRYFRFTPASTMGLRLDSEGSCDTKIAIYDADGNQLASDDDSGENRNFLLDYRFRYNTPYYIGVKMWSSSSTGTFTVNVRRAHSIMFIGGGGQNVPDSLNQYHGIAVTIPTDIPTKSYTLTYNANGGTVEQTDKTVDAVFTSWNTREDGSGTTYNPGDAFMPNGFAVLCAQWDNPKAGDLAVPERDGYTFEGWYTAADGGIQITSETVITGNQTLYAHWLEKSCVIHYSANGGKGAPQDQIKTGESIKISSVIPEWFIFTFRGWSTSYNAKEPEYMPGDVYTGTSDLNLYAVWGYPTVIDSDIVSSNYQVNIPYGGICTYFTFVPDETAIYRFESTGNCDTYITIYDGNCNELAHNDDGGENHNFQIDMKMEGGETYCIKVNLYSSTSTGSFEVSVDRVFKNPFTDVSESAYYYDAVLWAYENGITAGKDAAHFQPNITCTRAEVVTFLWRAKGQPEPKTTKNPFVDVKTSDYFYKAVLWAAENGITAGKDAAHFQPSVTVTRNQFVTFLWRAEGQPAPTIKNPFTDVPSGQYYTDAVLWAFESGITAGKDAAHFQPTAGCTRGQVVSFLYRAYH